MIRTSCFLWVDDVETSPPQRCEVIHGITQLALGISDSIQALQSLDMNSKNYSPNFDLAYFWPHTEFSCSVLGNPPPLCFVIQILLIRITTGYAWALSTVAGQGSVPP